MNVKKAAKIMQVSPSYLYEILESGECPFGSCKKKKKETGRNRYHIPDDAFWHYMGITENEWQKRAKERGKNEKNINSK